MITGTVSAFREAIIRLVVRGPQGQEQQIEAVIDTGFNGSLTLPSALVSMLALPFRRRGRAQLADGSSSLFDIFEATVVWDGQPRRVSVDAVETDPLVGMGLLYGYELMVQAIDGGSVSIQALAGP
jgi:clan AA aspartic protease